MKASLRWQVFLAAAWCWAAQSALAVKPGEVATTAEAVCAASSSAAHPRRRRCVADGGLEARPG